MINVPRKFKGENLITYQKVLNNHRLWIFGGRLIFVPNIGGTDLILSAIIDILTPTKEDFLSYMPCLMHKNQSFS